MKNPIFHIATAVTVLFSPIINLAQAPNLGTAANFVLFTSVGAVGNTGISQLTGNVGTNNGGTTGFGNVNGVMHSGDGATGTASTDLLHAYTQLDTITPTNFSAPLLGNGVTLTKGVYSIDGNTTLNLSLILDGKGDSGAVFIFQIGGTFSANTSSKIVLVNGTQACDVFWKVEGVISIAPSAFMRGTFIANNAAINMTTNDTLEGRILSTAGAVAVDGVLAYTPSGCNAPKLTGPVAPTFVRSGCFAIFSGNGAVSNSGITHVTGDIGTNVGLTTGYDPLYVTGYIHPVPDGFTAAAASDLQNVYTYLNTLPNDIELLYPAQFGHNLVLTPHTYIMNGAATFTDSLYLNGQGNYNAVFVIKIKGALSTSTFSKVILINGAQAKNVYWMVDGAVKINDNSVFNGTIVCNNAAISLTTGVTLNGRALTTNGALSTAAIIATSPAGNCNVLPVSWLYLRGKPVIDNVVLEWGVTNEVNNGFFTLEKSRDGVTFETLTSINASEENGQAEYNYSFTDRQPYNIGYYRISQTDKNGQKSYFRTIVVKLDINQTLKVFNYVLGNFIYVQASGAEPSPGFVELYGIDGKKLFSQKITMTRELSRYKIEKPVNKGVYLLNIVRQGEKLYHGKVMVL